MNSALVDFSAAFHFIIKPISAQSKKMKEKFL